MARAKIVDADKIAYFSPETLGREGLAERLAQTDDPAEALEILNSQPTVGEFRVQEEALIPIDGPDGTTVLGPSWGNRAVWVDDAPDDPEDGSGHFEVYDAERHGDYNPHFRQEA